MLHSLSDSYSFTNYLSKLLCIYSYIFRPSLSNIVYMYAYSTWSFDIIFISISLFISSFGFSIIVGCAR